jgi:tetratricopeptide (TPR) repeat protein
VNVLRLLKHEDYHYYESMSRQIIYSIRLQYNRMMAQKACSLIQKGGVWIFICFLLIGCTPKITSVTATQVVHASSNNSITVWNSAPKWIREIREFPADALSLPFLNHLLRLLIIDAESLEDSENADLLIKIGVLYFPTDAFFLYRQGLVLIPTAPERAGQYLALAENFNPSRRISIEPILKALGNTSVALEDYWLGISDALAAAGEWRIASYTALRALQIDPDSPSALAMLGQIKDALGEDGLEYLSEALSIDPSSTYALALMGMHWLGKGDLTSALEYFTLLAALQPEESAWRINIGNIAARKNDFGTSLDAFQAASDLQPEELRNWQQLAQFCLAYSIQVQSVGHDAATQSLLLAPDDPLSSEIMARVFLFEGDKDDAGKFFQRALSLNPDFSSSHYYLGVLLFFQGRKLEAYNQLFEVIRISGDDDYGAMAREFLEKYFTATQD